VIAGEQKAILAQQRTMSLRVAGRRHDHESRCQLPRPRAIQNHFGIQLRRQLVPVNDVPGVEMSGVSVGVGHVVAVRQEDVRNAARAARRTSASRSASCRWEPAKEAPPKCLHPDRITLFQFA
jgi:hypothetical protein